MKKLFLICAAFLLFASVLDTYAVDDSVQRIILQEISVPMPLDDFEEDSSDSNPPYSHFSATLQGNTLQVITTPGTIARMQVVNNTSYETVIDKTFNTQNVSTISHTGSYTLYIVSRNKASIGLFEIL